MKQKKSSTISEAQIERYMKNIVSQKDAESWFLKPNQVTFNDSKWAAFKNNVFKKIFRNPELWHQNRSTSKIACEQPLILSRKKLNPKFWHKTKSLLNIQKNEKLLISNFLKKRWLNKEILSHIRSISKIQNEQYMKTIVPRKNAESWTSKPIQIKFNDSKRAAFEN